MIKLGNKNQIAAYLLVFGTLFWRFWDLSFQTLWTEKWSVVPVFFGSALILATPVRDRLIKFCFFYFLLLASASSALSGYHELPLMIALRSSSLDQLLMFFCFLIFLSSRISLKNIRS